MDERAAHGGVRRPRGEVIDVVAGEDVVVEDQAEVARLVRQRGVAGRRHVDGRVADRVRVHAANRRDAGGEESAGALTGREDELEVGLQRG